MAGALEGLRVVDFGTFVAGPLAAMLLADQGADVVRVERPGASDTPANAVWNRGKRAIALDLKSPAGRQAALQLMSNADVVIENFRPGVMDRLGLGPAAALEANPRLIYCSLPGFASDDPRRDVRAWEGVVAAATATYRPASEGGQPIYTALPISSSYGAFLTAASVAMALNARERDGAGQYIEVPLFDATFAALGIRGYRVHNPRPGDDLALGRMIGWTRQFLCKDGRWFMYHAGNQNAADFFKATGASEWLTHDDGGAITPDELRERTEALFLTRTAAEWEATCEELATEGAICRTSDEWLDDPHAVASRIVVDRDDHELGRFRGPGINVRMSATPAADPAPRVPAVTGAAAEGTGWAGPQWASAAASSRRPAALAALDSVRVLDLCIILAGPTSARTLAELGADVIKIDSPHRGGVIFHNDVNRGKRSIVLDLKRPEGLEVFWKLVDTADVVVQNFRKGVADRLGVGYDAVRARKPDIVYASLNTYGQVGPYAGRPGHEQIAQAASGMQVRYGGDGRPVLAPFAVNDYGTGFMGAYGIGLALLHRKRTGQGQHVDTALAYTATMLQSQFLQRYEGKQWDEPAGQDALGSGPLHRAYEASDGWLFVGARQQELAAVPGLEGVAGLDGSALETELEARFRTHPVSEWVALLTKAGVGAHAIVTDVPALMQDPWVVEHGLSLTRDHDGIGPVTTTGAVPRLSRTPVRPGAPASRPGADAASILADAGADDRMEKLIDDGLVVTEGIVAR